MSPEAPLPGKEINVKERLRILSSDDRWVDLHRQSAHAGQVTTLYFQEWGKNKRCQGEEFVFYILRIHPPSLLTSESPCLESQPPYHPGGGGGGYPRYFLYRDVPTVRVSFSGSSVLNGYTISHFRVLNRVVSVNFLLFSPFDHIIFADFVCLRWNTWKRKLACCL